MKKLGLIMMLSGMMVSSSFGVVTILWSGPVGSVTQEDGSPAPVGWLTQLIFTPSQTIGSINNADPFTPTGDNVLLQTQSLNGIGQDGRIIGDNGGPSYSEDDSLEDGFVFARVFNVTSASDPITSAFRYGDSQTIGNPNNTATGGLSVFVATSAATTLNRAAPIVAVNQAIPEPSTYALIAMGGVVAFWRNRRQAKQAE